MSEGMELDATILKRLQELSRWQAEQQERLMRQQQEQRDMLTFEQDRMYEALGLSVQNIDIDDSAVEPRSDLPQRYCNTDNKAKGDSFRESSLDTSHRKREESEEPGDFEKDFDNTENGNQSKITLKVPPLQLKTNRYLNYNSCSDGFTPRSEIPSDYDQPVISVSSEHTPKKNHRIDSDLSMEGVEPLPVDKPLLKKIALDDLPVPSPKKDFTTLLEERLRDCEAASEINTGQGQKPVIKRPFLKKGEGLARFRPNPEAIRSKCRIRPRSSSLSANMHLSSSSTSKGSSTPKSKDTPKNTRTAATATTTTTRNVAVPPTAQSKLNLKNVPPPKKKVRSKSLSAFPINKPNVNQSKIKTPVDMNISSDFETKQRREIEEMRIFELLEEKAENSSFCSNSSTVLALFRQSTPLKPKNMQKNTRDPKQRLIADTTKHDSSDTSLEEIVRNTKSNKSIPNSPVTKIRETVIQKDIVFSKWDSGRFADENCNANLSPNKRGTQQRSISAGSYKSMQHTKHSTIQFNNNNNIANNNNSRKAVVHSDEEDNICDISSSTNVDLPYQTNYHENIEQKGSNDEMENDNDGQNVSLHVRFSEYNEYKTIGLTDTSMISNDANPCGNRMEDKPWSDRSTSPETSDVEVLFSKSKTTNCPKISNAVKMLPPQPQKIESHDYKDESTDQTTDDEQYTSTCSTDTSFAGDNTISEANIKTQIRVNESDNESEVCNDSGSTIRQENDEVTGNLNGIESVDSNGTIFKSELLKTRLAELEREIDIFRKENAALANQRKKLQEEAKQLQKEFNRKEEIFEKERKFTEESMQEEKKRLAREKSALESRLREAREKSLQSKQERQEIQVLREQLEELREETSQKESRWQAAQARQKSQIRVLQTENAKLKQEVEKLRQLRGNTSRFRRPAATNTRAIHQINKQLDNKKKMSPKKDSSSDEETVRPRIAYKEYKAEEVEAVPENHVDIVANINDDGSKIIVYNAATQQSSNDEDGVRTKRNMYTDLLNEATQGLRGREELTIGKSANTLEKSMNRSQSVARNEKEDRYESNSSEIAGQRNLDNSFKRNYDNGIESHIRNEINDSRRSKDTSKSPARMNYGTQQEKKRSPERRTPSRNEKGGDSSANKSDIREVQCPDGHIEYWYPNGNVKKVFPDRNITKMIFYNGDVRENAEDGSVKYFYASTRTWHTTLPDGLEILEFPDGQVERRTKNGTIEVSFPDGSIRLLQADGTEKWVLPDGMIAETFPDGDKILSFPNGQREVHTKEHKRREYPDGTVKLVYPDGTQETRYSTGRVRVKDKDGNLIMDVHHR